MILINQNFKDITTNYMKDKDQYIRFDTDSTEFFDTTPSFWFTHTFNVYDIQIGKDVLTVPESYYMIIGDPDGLIDTITPNEICGREFHCLVIDKRLSIDSWTLEDIKIVGYREDVGIDLPNDCGQIVPISLNNRQSILVSSSECYNKIKNLTFNDIV